MAWSYANFIMAAAAHHAVVTATPAPKPNPNQFDLICTGKTTVVSVNKVTGAEDEQLRLRIDLDAKAWCGGECKRTYAIEGVINAAEIVLYDSDQPPSSNQLQGNSRTESRAHIDRATGVFRSSNYVISYGLRSGRATDATCEATSFSGIPKPNFCPIERYAVACSTGLSFRIQPRAYDAAVRGIAITCMS